MSDLGLDDGGEVETKEDLRDHDAASNRKVLHMVWYACCEIHKKTRPN